MPITLPNADVSTAGKLARFALAVRKALADLDQGLGGGGTDYQPQIDAANAAIAALTSRVTTAESNISTHESRLDTLDSQMTTEIAQVRVKVSATEPAHDGSQRDRDLWVKEA